MQLGEFTAEGTLHCPRLEATISRQECYERQHRTPVLVGKTEVHVIRDGIRDRYCRSGECSLGRFIAREFKRGTLTYQPKRPTPQGAKRGTLMSPRRKKKEK